MNFHRAPAMSTEVGQVSVARSLSFFLKYCLTFYLSRFSFYINIFLWNEDPSGEYHIKGLM